MEEGRVGRSGSNLLSVCKDRDNSNRDYCTMPVAMASVPSGRFMVVGCRDSYRRRGRAARTCQPFCNQIDRAPNHRRESFRRARVDKMCNRQPQNTLYVMKKEPLFIRLRFCIGVFSYHGGCTPWPETRFYYNYFNYFN